MRKMLFGIGLGLVLMSVLPAQADNYAATAGSGLTFGAKNIGGILFPWWIPSNSSGTELFTSGNAGYVQFPSAQAVTATLGAETTKVIGTVNQGTSPWVISGAVTGTFWPYLLGQQVAGSSVPIVLTAAQITTLTPPAAITGFATAIFQGTNTATTAHTCSVAGYSELGCLGQMDDDIKGPPPVNLNGTNTGLTGLTPGASATSQTGTIVAANIDNSSWAGVALGLPTNFGTTPGAVKVPGVNASLFMGTAINSATNGIYSNLLQGNAVISATNGLYGNILQGNAVLSATNGLFGNILQGNAVLSATNGLYGNLLQGNAVLSATNGAFAAITDNTNGPAAVKAASTPSPATDKSLSVTLNAGSNGIVTLGQTTKSASVPVTIASDQYVDPCQSPNVAKSSAVIGITSATTTALVAVSGSTTIYACGYDFTISEVITTANTLAFEYGTGTACATSPTALTGTFGAGGVVAAAPLHISYAPGHTVFKTPASSGLCALTAIGASGTFQGVITYVQQ